MVSSDREGVEQTATYGELKGLTSNYDGEDLYAVSHALIRAEVRTSLAATL